MLEKFGERVLTSHKSFETRNDSQINLISKGVFEIGTVQLSSTKALHSFVYFV